MRNALSIDLEDWYHPELVRNYIKGTPKPQISKSTMKILALLDKYKVKATFFILGEIAKKNPDLIKRIYNSGHEIASHGMSHLPLWNLNYHKLNKELKDFNYLLKKILGDKIKIKGFRAPTFSLDHSTKYALKCLINNDFSYDSSIFPIRNFFYGVKNSPTSIYKPRISKINQIDNRSKIIEFPLSVIKFGNLKIPICGGFYLRITPYIIFKSLLKKINKKKKPFIVYFHPWETYSKTFRIKQINVFKYFVTYFGINNNFKKFEKLLQDFEFEPVKNVIKNYRKDI